MGQNDNEDEKFCSFWIMQLTTEYEIYEFLPTYSTIWQTKKALVTV